MSNNELLVDDPRVCIVNMMRKAIEKAGLAEKVSFCENIIMRRRSLGDGQVCACDLKGGNVDCPFVQFIK